jgi:hypothetical protein
MYIFTTREKKLIIITTRIHHTKMKVGWFLIKAPTTTPGYTHTHNAIMHKSK